MTREEIVEGLKLLEDNMVHFDELQNDKGEWIDVHELLFEAIQALSQEPTKREMEREYLFQFLCEDFKKLQAENDDLRKRLEQEPCDDAISRDAVKEMICAEFVDTQDGMSEWRNAVNDVVENLLHKAEQLPSVTQKSGIEPQESEDKE